MKTQFKTLFVLFAAFGLLFTACSSGPTALEVTGNVDQEQAWSEKEVKNMDTMEAESTNKAGETSTYTGVLISSLLEEAGVQSDASTVVFVGDDGYTAEVALEEVMACEDCIVSFRNKGGFSIVMPGYSGKVQVKGVVEIQVK
jgi:predicted  nucleic acid-binding Zn-ribbon protein